MKKLLFLGLCAAFSAQIWAADDANSEQNASTLATSRAPIDMTAADAAMMGSLKPGAADIDRVRALCDDANATACVELGRYTFSAAYAQNGGEIGFIDDRAKVAELLAQSREIFTKGCEAGSAEACGELGNMYHASGAYYGAADDARDDKMALEYYRKSCNLEAGEPCAFVVLLNKPACEADAAACLDSFDGYRRVGDVASARKMAVSMCERGAKEPCERALGTLCDGGDVASCDKRKELAGK